MSADNFDDLVSKCVLSEFPHRMLYVFIHAAFTEDEGEAVGAVQILFDAHQPVQVGLTMDGVRATADAQNSDWNFVVVGIAKNSDASLPSEDQAKAFLADMREKVLIGDLEGFAFLDRTGHPVFVETEEIADDSEGDVVH
jgi:hypothetical protein